MSSHDAYTIEVRKVSIEGEQFFEARVRELPDVVEYAETVATAHELARDSIETAATIFREKGKEMPPPFDRIDDFSGRITLRISKSIHRALWEGAGRESVSLNQHIVDILSHHCGTVDAPGTSQGAATWKQVFITKEKKQRAVGQTVIQIADFLSAKSA